MQGLADGYFIIPYTLGNYLASSTINKADTSHPAFDEAMKSAQAMTDKILSINGKQTVDSFHKRLGLIMWDQVGMSRNEAGLKQAISDISKLREEFWSDLRVPGDSDNINTELEKALRVADFLELGELMARDALERAESCGGHFREESQTEENEAKRDDENYTHVSAWEFQESGTPVLHKEELTFENVPLTTRSYK